MNKLHQEVKRISGTMIFIATILSASQVLAEPATLNGVEISASNSRGYDIVLNTDSAPQIATKAASSDKLVLDLKNTKVTKEDINAAMKEASETYLKDVLGYTEDLVVSSDIIGITNGSLFDATQTVVLDLPNGKQFVKVVSWYDNEYSYTCQYMRMAKKLAEVLGVAK